MRLRGAVGRGGHSRREHHPDVFLTGLDRDFTEQLRGQWLTNDIGDMEPALAVEGRRLIGVRPVHNGCDESGTDLPKGHKSEMSRAPAPQKAACNAHLSLCLIRLERQSNRRGLLGGGGASVRLSSASVVNVVRSGRLRCGLCRCFVFVAARRS